MPPTEENGSEENGMSKIGPWETNLKGIVDGYHELSISTLSELILSQQQIRLQQAQLFSASIDNVRNLQQAHADSVRAGNIVTLKNVDTSAHEIAAETASITPVLSAMNATNRQTDSTTAQIAATLGALTAAINQMQSSLDNITSKPGE